MQHTFQNENPINSQNDESQKELLPENNEAIDLISTEFQRN